MMRIMARWMNEATVLALRRTARLVATPEVRPRTTSDKRKHTDKAAWLPQRFWLRASVVRYPGGGEWDRLSAPAHGPRLLVTASSVSTVVERLRRERRQEQYGEGNPYHRAKSAM